MAMVFLGGQDADELAAAIVNLLKFLDFRCRQRPNDSVDDLNWLLATTGSLTMMAYLLYSLSDHARGIFGVRATGFALLAPLVFVVIQVLALVLLLVWRVGPPSRAPAR